MHGIKDVWHQSYMDICDIAGHLMCTSVYVISRASEGRTVQVAYKGDVENTIRDIMGGLRSTCTYVGAAKLKELSRRTTFIRVTQQSSQMFN